MPKHARRRARRNYRDAWRNFADQYFSVLTTLKYAMVSLMVLTTAALTAYSLVRTG